jgi:hypothetical protein
MATVFGPEIALPPGVPSQCYTRPRTFVVVVNLKFLCSIISIDTDKIRQKIVNDI